MQKTLSILSLLVFCGASLPAETKSQSAIMAFNKGVQSLNATQLNEAISYFDQAIEKDSEFAEAYYARAVCKRNKENLQGAISDLNSATRYKQDYVDAYALRGSILYEQERWGEAHDDFNYVLERKPQDPAALLGRGLTALRQDQPSRARRDLSRFVRVAPNDPLVPRIKKFLGSFSAAEAGTAEEARSEASSQDRPMSAQSQRLAQELFFKTPEMADAYGNKVLRAENAEAAGDIYSHPSVGRPRAKKD